jgi:hypothetical protein
MVYKGGGKTWRWVKMSSWFCRKRSVIAKNTKQKGGRGDKEPTRWSIREEEKHDAGLT